MTIRRLPVKQHREIALRVRRVSTKVEKLVYVMRADKKLKYAEGRSRVVYIGTTSRGIDRMTSSVAARAKAILDLHGVEEFTVHVITARKRQRVKTWHKLERALLLAFREVHGEVPRCNSHGKKMKETDEFRYFSKARLQTILENLA